MIRKHNNRFEFACTANFVAIARGSLFSLSLTILLSGCGSMLSQPRCTGGEQVAIQEFLYFGTERATGTITNDEWSSFVAEVVTPSFASGFTVWPAEGQWQEGGKVIKEKTFVFNVIYPLAEDKSSSIETIIERYKNQFQQTAVLRVRSYACMSLNTQMLGAPGKNSRQ